MKFFGVSDDWINFFREFLQSPLKIGPSPVPVQVRKRGTPICHMLTNVFGESLLFIMDLYVNRLSGLSIHRIHDDFWFWSHNTEMVSKAWAGINNFVNLAGLKLNDEKSCSVQCTYTEVVGDHPITYVHGPEPLPQRKVKWGFLYLDSDGIFRINADLLDPHVKEMRKCLQDTVTVMDWVQCHNRYLHFFIRNFAEPAETFGKQHIVQIMNTLRAILKEVHKEVNGDAVQALKMKFSQIWKGKNVMDSFVYWPVKEGGLNLFNPFIDHVPLHEAYRLSEKQRMDAGHSNKFGKVIDQDKISWETLVDV